MKVKTSVTLSQEVLRAIDEVAGPGANRSAALEEAAAQWLSESPHRQSAGRRIKTSLTLSVGVVRRLDALTGPGRSRSAVLEEAAMRWVRKRRREALAAHDIEIYNRLADDPENQREHAEVMALAIPWWELGDDVEVLPEVEERWRREAAARGQG